MRGDAALMQGGHLNWRPSGASGEVTLQLARMMRDEPAVRQGLRVLQAYCLGGGLTLRFGTQGRVPPTPQFSQHMQFHYMEFCRQAIEAFMLVGFVPYRIRGLENGNRIPEPMPLGTYSWYVARGGEHQSTPWVTTSDGRIGIAPSSEEAEAMRIEYAPMLRYEIYSAYCKSKVHHHVFTQPHPFMVCMAPLMSVLPTYLALLHKRECVARADMFNSQPSIVLEQQEKHKINELVTTGQPIANAPSVEMRGRRSGDKDMLGGRQEMHYQLLEEFRSYSHLPDDSVTMIAPTNHTVHSLERVTTPLDLALAELAFVRRVASALGLPENLLLQGAHAMGGRGGGAASSGGAWSDTSETNNRQLLDVCRHINQHLELAMAEAYECIYGVSARHHEPIFQLVTVPTFSTEQLLQVWNAKLIDDGALSVMLEAIWGTPLGRDAIAARLEQRKAEFDLPFRDKKETPATSKKK